MDGACELLPEAGAASMSGWVTLIGDSVLDNGVYVRGDGASVEQWLRRKMEPRGWGVSLCAIDGDVIAGVDAQLRSVPSQTTHLILSIGGNDGLHELNQLVNQGLGPFSIMQALRRYRAKLARDYSSMLDRIQARFPLVHLALCTLYYPCFEAWWLRALTGVGVWLANGVIKAEARARGLPVIDLAQVFTDAQDYANPIEPGVPGGDKITTNMVEVLLRHDFNRRKSVTYADTRHSQLYHDIKVKHKAVDGGTASSVGEVRSPMKAGARDTRENEPWRGKQ